MKIISCKDRTECNQKVVSLIKEKIAQIKQHVVVAVPGGRSVRGIFEILRQEEFPWTKVHVFMTDERLVPLDDTESNFKQTKEFLFDHVDIPEENIHPFVVDRTKSDLGINRYIGEIQKYGGRYDIIILGVGEDGHIASLFPNHNSVKNKSTTFLTMNDAPKNPPERMSMSPAFVQNAEMIILLFYGEAKKHTYQKFMDKEVSVEGCPAKLALEAKDVFVMKDF